MKVAVVGAGIMGASTTLALTDRGHTVTLYDQFPTGHAQGSSHGNSRIVRRDYPDRFYSEIMLQGYPLWHDLSTRLGGSLLHESGLFYFGHQDSPSIAQMHQGLTNLGVSHNVLDHSQAKTVFPALKLAQNEIALHNTAAGWVDASLAVQGQISLAQASGATLRHERVEDPLTLRNSYDAVCLLLGPWTTTHVPSPLTVTAQNFVYLKVPDPAAHGPVWIEDQQHEIYGFPPEPGTTTVKFGVHSPGPQIDPDDPHRPILPEMTALLADFASRRFGANDPAFESAHCCLYTRTSNSDFLWGQAAPGVFWASPCSGHGFKFGPWIGQRMADFVEAKMTPQEIPRFNQSSSI